MAKGNINFFRIFLSALIGICLSQLASAILNPTTVTTAAPFSCQTALPITTWYGFNMTLASSLHYNDPYNIESVARIVCNSNYSSLSKQYLWTVSRVDATTGSVLQAIDVTGNPSYTASTFALNSRELPYSYYVMQVSATFVVTALNGLTHTFTATNRSYINVGPTGFLIYATPWPSYLFIVGYQQNFVFNPTQYSYDFDGILSGNAMSFQYYCGKIASDIESTQVSGIDLYSMTVDPTLLSYTDCFSSLAEFTFNSSASGGGGINNNMLTINKQAQSFTGVKGYKFKIYTSSYNGWNIDEYFFVGVYGSVPTLKSLFIYCVSPSICNRIGGGTNKYMLDPAIDLNLVVYTDLNPATDNGGAPFSYVYEIKSSSNNILISSRTVSTNSSKI